MVALGVTLLLASAGTLTGDALAPYRGQPVLSIDILSPAEGDAQELRPLVGIEPGYLLSTDDIQLALSRIYALGRFSDVGVTAERRSGTVSLTFYVKPIRRLTSLDIEGTGAADAGALRAALRLEPGDEVDSRTPARLAQLARTYLHEAGFPDATVAVEVTSEPDETPVSITVSVREGTPVRVRRIRFTGRPRLQRRLLADLVETEVGGILDMHTVSADQQRLANAYRTHGFFLAEVSEPRVDVSGHHAVVTFELQAGDRVRIALHGNSLLTRADILALWPEPAGALRASDVGMFADRLLDAYRRLGYFGARAQVRERRDPSEEVLLYDVTITEGEPFRVAELKFVGSKAFAPSLLAEQVEAVLVDRLQPDVLVQRLGTDRQCLAFEPRLKTGSNRCSLVEVPAEQRWVPEVYEEALTEIRAAYRNRGFLSARVGPAQPSFADTVISVRVPVDEGPQTLIGSIAFQDNEALESARLLALVEEATTGRVTPGAPFSAAGVEDSRIAILRRYRDLGYLYAKVFSVVELSDHSTAAAVTYRFEEGPQVRVERVLVRGNRFTREGVIRSRLSTEPGDLYRLDRAVEDQRSIAALGVFSNVRVKLIDEETPAERKDLVAEVVERNRHRIEPHIGLSTADGFRGGVSYSHNNVLGTASTFTGSIRLNRQFLFDLYGEYAGDMQNRYEQYDIVDEIEREIRTGIRSPKWYDLPLDPSARVDLVHERENAIPYSLDSLAVILGLDMALANRLTLAIEPQVAVSSLDCVGDVESVDRTRCVEQIPGVRPAIGRTQTGVRSTFKVGPTLTVDLRDSPFNPRRGVKATVTATYAVGSVRQDLQSESSDAVTFTKLQGSITGYLPLERLVLALSGSGGIIARRSEIEQIDERFFLGGRGTLRGFVENALIAQDACVAVRRSPVELDDPTAPVSPVPGDGPDPSPTLEAEGWTPPPPPSGCREQIVTREGIAPLTTGGNAFLLFKAELRIPLTDDFSIGFFLDAGNLWLEPPALEDLAFRVGLGAGLRFNTPVGPLAFDVGFNTDPDSERGERRYEPHFAVGVF